MSEVKILFASFIFYGFIFFMMSLPNALNYVSADISFPEPALVQETGNPLWDWLTGAWYNLTNFITVVSVVLINPFSAIGFISWFSIALMATNLYTIARLVRGGG